MTEEHSRIRSFPQLNFSHAGSNTPFVGAVVEIVANGESVGQDGDEKKLLAEFV
jgi:hypothetical protein